MGFLFFISKNRNLLNNFARKDSIMSVKKILKLSFVAVTFLFVVACGGTITEQTTTALSVYELPDLTGKTITEAEIILNDIGISYNFKFETTNVASADSFLRYEDGYDAGDSISFETTITVVIATDQLVLPNLFGMNQIEIFTTMQGTDINYSIEIITNNEVEDQTFAGYGSGLEVGDLIPIDFQLVIYIGFNTEKLPDLTNKLKGEITRILTDLNILHQFVYEVDDNYPEDSFIGYQNYEIGDFYEEDDVVTVKLYKNTFTEKPTSLIISKYIDGGYDTNDQAIELYNPTDSSIFLGDYHLVIYENGALTVTYRIDFPNIDLLPGELFLIANRASTNGDLLRKASSSGLIEWDLKFDGNDTIQLRYKNNTYIDTIYHIGNNAFIMDNEIFVRKSNVVVGTRDFNLNEWTSYIPTYIEIIGEHPILFDATEGPSFQLIPREFDSPLGGMNLVTLVAVTDGDTAEFSPGFIFGDRVRFLGVDAPETRTIIGYNPDSSPIYGPAEPWAIEAKNYVAIILQNAQQIYIQSDPKMGYTETYGRHLGLVWVDLGAEGISIDILSSTGVIMRTEHLSGWILLNYYLVLNGFSYNYYGSSSELIFDNRYIYRWFQDAEKFARENGLGIHE